MSIDGVQDVYFKGLAFDTAGSLHWPDFSAPLIDPENQDGKSNLQGLVRYIDATFTLISFFIPF